MPQSQRQWWHTASIYEVYPASFQDSNGDGIGDIPGLISRVDYLASLGVDAVWLAACYRSSGVDMGYDIVDYRDIDPQYGTVQDVKNLIAKLKEHNMRLIMDVVVNHTSDEHAWFKESRSSLDNPKRNWYIWRKGKTIHPPNGEVQRLPPNNWQSGFMGSAWEYDEATDEYYLRIFSKQQPDLNWDNPDMRQAVYDDMRFWLDKGVSGFRMDVINMISKPEGLPDAPITNQNSPWQVAVGLYCNGPRVHEYLRELRKEVLDPYGPEVMTVGEVICTGDTDIVRAYTDPSRRELDMSYTYDLFSMDIGRRGKFSPRPWTLSNFKHAIIKWQTALAYSQGAWQTTWLESHDSGRSITRFGDGNPRNRFKIAKLLALLQTTLGGTLYLYQGQELGLQNLDPTIPLSQYRDLETLNIYASMRSARAREQSLPESQIDMSDILTQIHLKARDHTRTPLPWTSASSSNPHAGFSSASAELEMWSPMNIEDSENCNIAQQVEDPHSVWGFWRKRLMVRKKFAETLVFGDFEVVEGTEGDGDVFAYWRRPVVGEGGKVKAEGEVGVRDVLVVLNLTGREGVEFEMPVGEDGVGLKYFVLDGTSSTKGYEGVVCSGEALKLDAYEGVVFGY